PPRAGGSALHDRGLRAARRIAVGHGRRDFDLRSPEASRMGEARARRGGALLEGPRGARGLDGAHLRGRAPAHAGAGQGRADGGLAVLEGDAAPATRNGLDAAGAIVTTGETRVWPD